MSEPARQGLLQPHSGAQRVTNIELFFDLVYVFAITQLSHHLLADPTVGGALQTLLLLAMVWWAWVYTTWATNWLDADRLPVRLMLVVLMLISLVLSVALPGAFGARGLVVASAYVVMQVGRSVFVAIAGRGRPLERIFVRVVIWCVVSGCIWLAGGLLSGDARVVAWTVAMGIDLVGGVAGFYTPGMGRTTSREWTIEGGHFAERCQAFIIIALGESIVVIGTTLARVHRIGLSDALAFLAAFIGSVALWWVYFDRSAEDGARIIAHSSDPGRIALFAYHLIHPVMVAGIIVAAAADARVLLRPWEAGDLATSLMVVGGPALFLAGHALYKFPVWRVISSPRIGAIVVLFLLLLAAGRLPALALGACVIAVVAAVAVIDRIQHPNQAEA
ncbi:MAG TPA: low temperature requirement protein A [Candidatus Dormibacteraeota bacterium]|jgi:low temperature requirement protein LtrA|nr:low temperature requirement protein A [Candidatus Dormibacteraeota bacterium]